MKPVVWFRITAVVLLLFAVGHTFGFLAFRPSTTEGRAVWLAMKNVHFAEGHSTLSYGAFYTGFGSSSQLSNYSQHGWCGSSDRWRGKVRRVFA